MKKAELLFALLLVVSIAASVVYAQKLAMLKGEEVTLTGRIRGIACFIHGVFCDPDHVWKKGEVAGLVTDKGKFYYLNAVPRDALVHFFLKDVRAKGTLYKELATLDTEKLEVKEEGKWSLVWKAPKKAEGM